MHWTERHKVIPAAYVILERGDKVLLLRRKGSGYWDGYYSLPSGHLEGGEPASVAASRECEEEVGIKLKPQELEVVHIMHRVAEEGSHERIDIFFRATSFSGEPIIAEPDKCDDLRWVPANNVPQNMVPIVRDVLDHIKQGRIYSEGEFLAPKNRPTAPAEQPVP